MIRSLAIIPLLAILVISCGKEEVVEEENKNAVSIEEAFGKNAIVIQDYSSSQGVVEVGEREFSYQRDNGEVILFDEDGKRFDYIANGYKLVEIQLMDIGDTPVLIEEYNKLAKKHKVYMDENNALIVWKDETARMQELYTAMNQKQKIDNEPWPYLGKADNINPGEIPPPPPPTIPTGEQGFIKVDGNIFRYTSKGATNEYYDHDGKLINVKGKEVMEIDASDVPPPPPPAKK